MANVADEKHSLTFSKGSVNYKSILLSKFQNCFFENNLELNKHKLSTNLEKSVQDELNKFLQS